MRTRSEFRDGMRAMVPVLVGIVPAGLAVGAGLAAAGVPAGPGLLSAATVYGATPQLVVADLAGRGAPVVVTVAVVAVASVRLVFYGAGLGRRFCGASAGFRWLAPLLIVHPAYAVAEARFARRSTLAQRRSYFLGAGLTLWVAWQVAHAVGMALGGVVPAALALDVALPLCLLALLAPSVQDRAARHAALVATAVAVLAAGLPFGTGIVVGAVAGITAGAREKAGR